MIIPNIWKNKNAPNHQPVINSIFGVSPPVPTGHPTGHPEPALLPAVRGRRVERRPAVPVLRVVRREAQVTQQDVAGRQVPLDAGVVQSRAALRGLEGVGGGRGSDGLHL